MLKGITGQSVISIRGVAPPVEAVQAVDTEGTEGVQEGGDAEMVTLWKSGEAQIDNRRLKKYEIEFSGAIDIRKLVDGLKEKGLEYSIIIPESEIPPVPAGEAQAQEAQEAQAQEAQEAQAQEAQEAQAEEVASLEAQGVSHEDALKIASLEAQGVPLQEAQEAVAHQHTEPGGHVIPIIHHGNRNNRTQKNRNTDERIREMNTRINAIQNEINKLESKNNHPVGTPYTIKEDEAIELIKTPKEYVIRREGPLYVADYMLKNGVVRRIKADSERLLQEAIEKNVG